MPKYAYAIIVVDGKRKVIRTKGYSDAKVLLAKNELEKDLKAAGIKYTYIGISEHPPTTAELEKTSKAAAVNPPAAKSMPLDTHGSFTLKAAIGNATRGSYSCTLRDAIEYAMDWSNDSEWDYRYGVDYVDINIYYNDKCVGYTDGEDWYPGKSVKNI